MPHKLLVERLSVAQASVPSDVVSHVSTRLLSILGTDDLLISAEASRAALEPVPFSTIVEIGGPHLIVQAHPAAAWAAISEEFERAA